VTDRFYKLICCQVKEPPPVEVLFPMLNREIPTDDEVEPDDAANFRAVTASLMPYNGPK
jgi:hypothetical protein